MIYKVGIGHGLGTDDLEIVTPQPTSRGVQTTRRTYAADASVYEEGPYAELIFNTLGDAETYTTLLNQFGLLDALSQAVTVRLRSQFFTDTLYNGTAIRPEQGKENDWKFFARNVVILIRDLEQLVEG